VLDLYAGVGLFARFLADAVGDPAALTLVEGDRAACGHAERNVPGATVLPGDVGAVLSGLPASPVDLVVLDPPREGARRTVVEVVAARRPRAVAYVACDPAALARDLAVFAEHGYRLDRLRAFDLFPMTHHVECVALVVPTDLGG
jgi:tRNA/tmRNA/rRNA uracil-C5-methylase (TrmA/RlmC/RlmD family)